MYADLFVGGVCVVRMSDPKIEDMTNRYSEFVRTGLHDTSYMRLDWTEFQAYSDLGRVLMEDIARFCKFCLIRRLGSETWEFEPGDDSMARVGRHVVKHEPGVLDLALPGVVWPQIELVLDGQEKVFTLRPEARWPVEYRVQTEMRPTAQAAEAA